MKNVTAVLSMIHEPSDGGSATRLFRQDPVLAWTLDRLTRSKRISSLAILCWEDQQEAVMPIAQEAHAHMLVKGPRHAIAAVESVAAAQKFADGWRGGLLSTCEFDRGFHASWFFEIATNLESEALLLIDPASGLIDGEILDAIVERAEREPECEILFTQAAPGLAGALLRPSLVERLAKVQTHPGRILHYMPDQPARDPIGGEACITVPTAIARTTRRFKLDSNRQVDRITSASISLNGTLATSSAVEILNRLEAHHDRDAMPRDVTIELTARRQTNPIFSPLKSLAISRPDLELDSAEELFSELAAEDDIRLTFAGVGDPLLHENFVEIITAASTAGLDAIQGETDRLADVALSEHLVDCGVDIVSVHLPAMQAATLCRDHGRGSDEGCDVEHQAICHAPPDSPPRRLPLLVPTFGEARAQSGGDGKLVRPVAACARVGRHYWAK